MGLLQALNLPSPPASAAKAGTAGKASEGKAGAAGAKAGKLLQAAEAWRQTQGQANAQIAALKAAVKSHCADAPPPLRQEVDKGLLKLDGVMKTLDHRLADALASAGNAGDDGARKVELDKAKVLVADFINYVKSEPLVAHIDQNPFGVKTGLQALLAGGLAQAAKVI